MALAYLSLGSNLGNRSQNLSQALEFLRQLAGDIVNESASYEYRSWGYDSENLFLNVAVILETGLMPVELLKVIKDIEKKLGREKGGEAYMDRPIDIDIIFYDDLVLDMDDLVIPHPLMHQRKFVLEPLCEIAPNIEHAVIGKTVKELYSPFKGSH